MHRRTQPSFVTLNWFLLHHLRQMQAVAALHTAARKSQADEQKGCCQAADRSCPPNGQDREQIRHQKDLRARLRLAALLSQHGLCRRSAGDEKEESLEAWQASHGVP